MGGDLFIRERCVCVCVCEREREREREHRAWARMHMCLWKSDKDLDLQKLEFLVAVTYLMLETNSWSSNLKKQAL